MLSPWLVRGLVLLLNTHRNPATVTDLIALRLSPLADVGAVLAVGSRPPSGGRSAADLPGVWEVLGRHLVEGLAVLGAEVYFHSAAVETDGARLSAWLPAKVARQRDLDLLCHFPTPW